MVRGGSPHETRWKLTLLRLLPDQTNDFTVGGLLVIFNSPSRCQAMDLKVMKNSSGQQQQ